MKGLYPTVLTHPSPLNNCFYPIPVHNAQAMIEPLLYLSLAKDDNNLLFPNPDDPLAPPPSVVQNIADSDIGDVYRTSYICGIICYIDKLATGQRGHLSLEPVYFTLSIINKKTRNRLEAWRPLGYIPNIGIMSKAESTHAMKRRFSYIMIFFPESLVPLLTFKAKKVVFPISFSTVEKCTMPYCCSRYLLSLVIPKVMIVFAADTTVADQVLLACAVTVIFPTARPTMLTMSGNILYLN
jgi:hypothetical protein